MRKGLIVASLAVAVGLTALLGNAKSSDAAFHLMRIHNVMGGASGSSTIQYVELRMSDPGQNFVSSHVICFFDTAGAPYARFTFPGNVASGADEASILIGTAEFDAAWAAGSPDFTFSAANTTAIAAGADVNHPIRQPGGKVIFGSDSSGTPGAMCQAGLFDKIDSVAYGTGYTGLVEHPAKFPSDLPTSGTQEIHYTAATVCHPNSFTSPCGAPRDNSANYALVDANTAGNNPRNNGGASGPISPDTDGDGVSDASDNCPSWPNPAQTLPPWTVPANDPDCDGFTTTSENFSIVDANQHCAGTVTANDEVLPDRWSVDFNDDQKATIIDVSRFSPVFGAVGPNAPYDKRFDYNGSNNITITDVSRFSSYFGKACAP
jgi:hypothetical protein